MNISARRLPLWSLLAVGVVAVLGTGAVYSFTAVTLPGRYSLYQSSISPSNLKVLSQTLAFPDLNDMTVTLSVQNADGTVPHSASLLVALIDSTGKALAFTTVPTGNVAAGVTVSIPVTFSNVPNVAINFANDLILVQDLT